MSARQELVDNGGEAIADLTREYRRAVAAIVELVRTATGVELVPSARPSVMDATREQLEDAAGRARQALRAMDLVLGVHWGDCTTLGEVIRDEYWDQQDRELIAEHLAAAGLS
ncbi:hypothetical protein [Streptomyces sp. NPDC001221]